jgi:hypothetical protein
MIHMGRPCPSCGPHHLRQTGLPHWSLRPGPRASFYSSIQILGTNQLTAGILPPAWSALTSIEALYLSNNHLNGTLPPAWSAFTAIEALYLYYNQLIGTLPPAWSSLTYLFYMELQGNTRLYGTIASSCPRPL